MLELHGAVWEERRKHSAVVLTTQLAQHEGIWQQPEHAVQHDQRHGRRRRRAQHGFTRWACPVGEPADSLELEAVQLEKEAEQKVDEADQKVGDERLVAVWPGLESICAGATRAKGHADEEEVGMGMD